jgi:hypothetical protein
MSKFAQGDFVEFNGQPGYVWMVVKERDPQLFLEDEVMIQFVGSAPNLPRDQSIVGFTLGDMEIARVCNLKKLTTLELLALQADT